ncbi:putative ankyrin repeat protein RF_0381 [Patella vulgata]|uniref:putative ankyrin repeat protein RF_0381 n=1 Tax=Patella vulgata TaxID=6465 RepID=UPI00217F6225|nr:putative ankyrin repeat protein RF_0381 [Patella vulgata]
MAADELNNRGEHMSITEQLQKLLFPDKHETASTTDLPQRLAPGQAMIHKQILKENVNNDRSDKSDTLQDACRNGSVGDVKHLIDHGVDVNRKGLYGRSCILLCCTSLIEPIEKIELLRSNEANIQDIDDENNGMLHLACGLGTLETVRYLVNIGVDFNTKGFKGRSCIMACSESKTQAIDKIELLRKIGGNIQDIDVNNDSMLHLACLGGTLETVRYLIDQGLDIHTTGRYGRTCLLLCSQSQTQAIKKIELLRSKGCNIFDCDDNNDKMLNVACTFGKLNTVRYLIDLGLDVNSQGGRGRTSGLKCCPDVHPFKSQAAKRLKLLRLSGGNIIDFDADNYGMSHLVCGLGPLGFENYKIKLLLGIKTKTIGEYGRTCILNCSQSKTQAIEKIELLRQMGGDIHDVDADNNGILHMACISGTLNTVKYLIGLGMDINTKGRDGCTCIVYCCQSTTQAIAKIEFLRSKGAYIFDTHNDLILHFACAFGTLDTVRYLIDLGFDINTKGFKGRTCILNCIKCETQAIKKIELLRLKGGNIHDTDDDNNGILHLACAYGTLDTVKYLIGLGLDIDKKSFVGRTCMLQSSISEIQTMDKIEFLRSKGGSIHDTDNKNSGLLHLACLRGTLDIVRYLIDLGLDINTKGFEGRTCMLICSQSKIQAIGKIELLRSKGGKIYDRDDINNAGILHFACADGKLDTVQYLVNLGLDITTKDKLGHAPISLSFGSDVQSREKVEYLISKGAKLSRWESIYFKARYRHNAIPWRT